MSAQHTPLPWSSGPSIRLDPKTDSRAPHPSTTFFPIYGPSGEKYGLVALVATTPPAGTDAMDTGPDNLRLFMAAPALASQVARLREGLDKTERMLTALATSELNIDHDRNRTPTRLVQRDSVWRAIESARALLAETEGVK